MILKKLNLSFKHKKNNLIKIVFFVFLFTAIYLLVGCSRSTNQKSFDTDLSVRPNPNQKYQLGVNWNREPLTPILHYPYQVLNMNRSNYGDVGVGVYLGQINIGQGDEKAIGMTVAHLYPYLESCKQDVSFLIQDQGNYHYYPCAGWNFNLNESDIMFFEIDKNSADIKLLVPVLISKNPVITNQIAQGILENETTNNHSITNHPIRHQAIKNQQLKLITFERNLVEDTVVLNTDSSSECIILSDQIKHIADPDGSDDRMITSWSVAMGCDSKHGDSGAPVYDEQSNLLGLLWTGKYPKESISQNSSEMNDIQVWDNSNYFVPVQKIKEELNQLLSDPNLSSPDKDMLSKILVMF